MLWSAFETDEDGQLLLHCIRAYAELDLLAPFEVHMDETINYGRKMAEKFMKLVNVSHSPRT